MEQSHESTKVIYLWNLKQDFERLAVQIHYGGFISAILNTPPNAWHWLKTINKGDEQQFRNWEERHHCSNILSPAHTQVGDIPRQNIQDISWQNIS